MALAEGSPAWYERRTTLIEALGFGTVESRMLAESGHSLDLIRSCRQLCRANRPTSWESWCLYLLGLRSEP